MKFPGKRVSVFLWTSLLIQYIIHTFQGINSKVSYKIVSVISRNPFALDAESGQLTVTSSLDREETPSYEVIIGI